MAKLVLLLVCLHLYLSHGSAVIEHADYMDNDLMAEESSYANAYEVPGSYHSPNYFMQPKYYSNPYPHHYPGAYYQHSHPLPYYPKPYSPPAAEEKTIEAAAAEANNANQMQSTAIAEGAFNEAEVAVQLPPNTTQPPPVIAEAQTAAATEATTTTTTTTTTPKPDKPCSHDHPGHHHYPRYPGAYPHNHQHRPGFHPRPYGWPAAGPGSEESNEDVQDGANTANPTGSAGGEGVINTDQWQSSTVAAPPLFRNPVPVVAPTEPKAAGGLEQAPPTESRTLLEDPFLAVDLRFGGQQ